jgi:hypothetical protein
MASQSIKAEIKGVKAAVKKLNKLGGKHLGYAQKLALLRAGQYLNTEITKNLTLHDHSLEKLKKMGHPYAQRHGSIGVHQNKPFVVHSQTGRLANTLFYKMKGGVSKPIFRTGLKYNRRYNRYIITGTRVMLPRNVLYDTSQQKKVRMKMMIIVRKELGKYLAARAKGGLTR